MDPTVPTMDTNVTPMATNTEGTTYYQDTYKRHHTPHLMKDGCTSTCTSHLVFGETAAVPMGAASTTTTHDSCCAGGWGATYSHHHSNKHDDVWGGTYPYNDRPHDTTTSTIRMENHLQRNYDRLQFDRRPRAPTMPTPPQAPTKPPATTMTAAAPMVAASSTPVYGSPCVGQWGAYHYIHSDTKGNEWNKNVMMAMTSSRVSHFAMIPHPLSYFHAGLYCFPVLVYKGQATPSSSSFSSLDPCTLLHTVQWKGSSSEFHFPNVPKVAHLTVFLFGPRNALVLSLSCILPVKLSREVGSNSTCSYVEF